MSGIRGKPLSLAHRWRYPPTGGFVDLEQFWVVPDVHIVTIRQKPPAGRQRQERKDNRTAPAQMLHAKRLEEVGPFGELASPDVPTICTFLWWMTQTVHRRKMQR